MFYNASISSINIDIASKSISHKEAVGVRVRGVRHKDLIYYNIDTQNRADLSPVCMSGRGRDIKNSSGDGRGCHMEYVASCSDDHSQWAICWCWGNIRLLLQSWHQHWRDTITEVEGDATKQAQCQHHQQHLVWLSLLLLKSFNCFTFFSFCIKWLRQIIHKPTGVSCPSCNNLSSGWFNYTKKNSTSGLQRKWVHRLSVGQLGWEQVFRILEFPL